MGHHLTAERTFKSDKYPWCPEGFFALKLTDPIARKCAQIYAAQTKDAELALDLMVACDAAEVRASPPDAN
ncbi:MAG: hypothetical protein V3S55_09625 [Nitrospiraceae bacterium]